VARGRPGCTYTARATSLTVTAPDGCAWTASEAASWLTITSGGSGSGTVSFGYPRELRTGVPRSEWRWSAASFTSTNPPQGHPLAVRRPGQAVGHEFTVLIVRPRSCIALGVVSCALRRSPDHPLPTAPTCNCTACGSDEPRPGLAFPRRQSA